ncbi:MAG: alpha-D-xyloside xylohydrolase [Frankiales bacterium]|nr:alpha-D-xyloside xylohydrolase [Frankiales bacterium]
MTTAPTTALASRASHIPFSGRVPLLADPTLRVDPIVAIREVDGGLEVECASGAVVAGAISRCGDAVRLRVGPALSDSPMLQSEYAEQPLTLGDAVSWTPGALRLNEVLHEAPRVGSLEGAAAATGRILDADGTMLGWAACFSLAPDAAVFGGGECFQGPDLRGRVRVCVNREAHGAAGLDASYLTVPFVWSDAGWGLYAHSGGPVRIDAGATHGSTLVVEVAGETLDLFAYRGDGPQVIASHQQVTGLPGRFPDWALGVWTSRCSYLTAEEVESVLDGYDAAQCPVDVVHVDAWQPGNVMVDLSTRWEVNRDRWPLGWAKALDDRGVRLSLWHNPYVRAGTTAGDDAIARGLVLRDADGELVDTADGPGRLVIDFTHPDAEQWWHEHVAVLVAEGASAVKPDFAEELPPHAVAHDGRQGWQLRNEYALRYQRASYSALLDLLPDSGDGIAMFVRSGTAGAQRYPCHWVGDTPSTWEGLEAALRACLSLSLSGFGFVTSDAGGFWTPQSHDWVVSNCESGDGAATQADVDPELFTRWTQWAALSPVLRFHGTGRREPWAYPGEYGEASVQACRQRAALRPYLEVVSAETSSTGTPFMRPMPLAFPRDRAARSAHLQYLLGPDLLVAPVLQPGGAVRVWAPEGGWTGLAGAPPLHEGWNDIVVSLSAMPAWVRPGAVL